MYDPNVVVNLRDRGFKKAFKVLQGFGAVSQTDFFNVLAMKVSDIDRFLETLRQWVSNNPDILYLCWGSQRRALSESML